MQKPVYKLVQGDVFVGEDGRQWSVDEIIEPDDWRTLGQVNTRGKNWEIRAHAAGQMNRRFYYQGTKLVTMKGSV